MVLVSGDEIVNSWLCDLPGYIRVTILKIRRNITINQVALKRVCKQCGVKVKTFEYILSQLKDLKLKRIVTKMNEILWRDNVEGTSSATLKS